MNVAANIEIEDDASEIKKAIKSYQDFPAKNVIFRDVFSILREPRIFGMLHKQLLQISRKIQPEITCIVGLDSRGFLFGPLISLELRIPFVPVRKKGKLPGETLSESYNCEYSQDVFEIQSGSIKKEDNVLIVDDLLATGGSLAASVKLIQQVGAKISACLVVIELLDLNGRKNIPADVYSVVQF